jgi:hypothetical protein
VSTQTTGNLFTEAAAERAELPGLREQVACGVIKITHFKEEIDRLRGLIAKLQKQSFGLRSERWENDEQGKLLLNEAEVEAANPESEDEACESPSK